MTEEITTTKEIKLTLKQRLFLKEYFQTGNGTLSAMKVYDCKDYNTASVMASETLRKLKDRLTTLMEVKGLSVGDLLDTLQEARKAKIRRRNLETGEVFYEPDHRNRIEAVKVAAKFLGLEVTETQQQQNIVINVHPEFIKKYGSLSTTPGTTGSDTE